MESCQSIQVVVAAQGDFPAAQDFYEARGYGGAPIEQTDFVVVARQQEKIVGVGRLCLEQELLWLRGMQVEPQFRRAGIGARILELLDREIGGRMCCCLPYAHLVEFYRRAGFACVSETLPEALDTRLADYLSRGLEVVPMIRPAPPTFPALG